jgi:hypothetical protein
MVQTEPKKLYSLNFEEMPVRENISFLSLGFGKITECKLRTVGSLLISLPENGAKTEELRPEMRKREEDGDCYKGCHLTL